METPSDAALIVAVLDGQRDRFAQLVERYQGPLLKLARSRLGRYDWAEDVVQETFLWAYKSLASYDSRYNFRTWLWTILLNQCNRHWQRRQRQPAATGVETSGPAALLLSEEVSPAESLLAKERAEQLADVLAELPEEQADALRLRFFGELKFQEIADVQGCSLTTAKNRVRFGLLKVAQRLQPERAGAVPEESHSA